MTSFDRYTTTSAKNLKADVLLVTATKIEAQAVCDRFEGWKTHPIGNNTYYDLGTIQGARIFMVYSDMGAGGPGGAGQVITESIQTLSPTSIVMVGIAFGVDPQKQHIGHILVSRQLLCYEPRRIGTVNGQKDIQPRGDRPMASPRLLDRFRNGCIGWRDVPVEIGLILTGEKLADHKPFRDSLLRFAPEAIGGEMEGAGLYAAAYRHKVDWILVKAICDWADGNKDEEKQARQRQAAENAIRFVIHVLEQGGFSDLLKSPGEKRKPGELYHVYNEHASWVITVDWDPAGSRIASAGSDGTVRVWDADTAQSLLTYRGHTRWLAPTGLLPTIYTVAWSPDGRRIASAGDGAKVHIWNPVTGQNVSVYREHTGIAASVYAVSWSPESTRIASACSSVGFDRTLHIWDVKTGRTLLHCQAGGSLIPSFSILAAAWSPDGTRIAATCDDKAIRVWNASTGQPVLILNTRANYASDVKWSHDSQQIASVGPNHTVQVWDAATGELLFAYCGHTDTVRWIAWSPDDTCIASASNDTTVQIWNPATGDSIFTYHGHKGWATSLAWSPDGTRIASASNDKSVQVWQAH